MHHAESNNRAFLKNSESAYSFRKNDSDRGTLFPPDTYPLVLRVYVCIRLSLSWAAVTGALSHNNNREHLRARKIFSCAHAPTAQSPPQYILIYTRPLAGDFPFLERARALCPRYIHVRVFESHALMSYYTR